MVRTMDGSPPLMAVVGLGGGRSARYATVRGALSRVGGMVHVKRPDQDRYPGLPRALAERLPTGRSAGSGGTSRCVPAGLGRSSDRGRLPVAAVSTPGSRLPGCDRMSCQRHLGFQGRSGGATAAECAEVPWKQDLSRQVGRRAGWIQPTGARSHLTWWPFAAYDIVGNCVVD